MNTITMTNEEICVKIDEICNELTEASEAISKLSPVTHKSKSMVGWSGGIIGAILDWREEKRLVKLMNAPITVGDQKNVALDISVDSSIKESFKLMDLPEDVKIDEDNTSASGCMGAILLMFTIPIATFLVGFYALNG